MGMRHMLVTDKKNRVEGMITRKDLIPFNLTLKLERVLDEELEDSLSNYSGEIACITKPSRLKHDSIMEEDELDGKSESSASDRNNNTSGQNRISPRGKMNGAHPVTNDTPL